MITMETGTALTVAASLVGIAKTLWDFSKNTATLGAAIEELRKDMKEEREERKEDSARNTKLFDEIIREHSELKALYSGLKATCNANHG